MTALEIIEFIGQDISCLQILVIISNFYGKRLVTLFFFSFLNMNVIMLHIFCKMQVLILVQ